MNYGDRPYDERPGEPLVLECPYCGHREVNPDPDIAAEGSICNVCFFDESLSSTDLHEYCRLEVSDHHDYATAEDFID